VVDASKLGRFVTEGLLPGHFQPLWQLLQCTPLAEQVPSWNLLTDDSFLNAFELPEVDVHAQSAALLPDDEGLQAAPNKQSGLLINSRFLSGHPPLSRRSCRIL